MTQSKKFGVAELNAMTPYQVLEDETVKQRFISLYEKIHKAKDGEVFYEKEKYNYIRIIQASRDLPQCTGFSIYGCFLDIAHLGLSLEQSSKPLLYALFYNINTGTRQSPQWEKRATLDVSPYGELVLRIKAGQLRHADHPVILYEGDQFQPKMISGKNVVDYIPKIPRQSNKIIGGFIGLTRGDGSKEYFWMLQEEIDRLRQYSNRKNRGDDQQDRSNALYTSNNGQIDPGFLEAKLIKHAFRTFPKVKTGEFSKLSDEDPDPINYGLDETVHSQAPAPEPIPAQEADSPQDYPDRPEAFGENPQVDEDGVVVDDQEDVF